MNCVTFLQYLLENELKTPKPTEIGKFERVFTYNLLNNNNIIILISSPSTPEKAEGLPVTIVIPISDSVLLIGYWYSLQIYFAFSDTANSSFY